MTPEQRTQRQTASGQGRRSKQKACSFGWGGAGWDVGGEKRNMFQCIIQPSTLRTTDFHVRQKVIGTDGLEKSVVRSPTVIAAPSCPCVHFRKSR